MVDTLKSWEVGEDVAYRRSRWGALERGEYETTRWRTTGDSMLAFATVSSRWRASVGAMHGDALVLCNCGGGFKLRRDLAAVLKWCRLALAW